jgi:hypothetical protein
MTDVIRPANGQTTDAQSTRNAWQDPHSTAGYDVAIGEETLMASESGEASARPKRLGAVSPTGWFLPADGEAAPPFRHGMEPARSDDTAEASGANDDDDDDDDEGDPDGAWYQDPQPTSVHQVRAAGPWSFRAGSRRPVPVVGPTEALRGRAGGPGMAVPQGAVPGLLDPEQRSGWQLAQQVWQESGVSWERAGTEPAAPESARAEFAGAEPADIPPAGMGSAGMGSARTWFEDAEPADIEPAEVAPAGMGSARTWFEDPEPAAPEPADFAPAGRESAGPWSDAAEPADAEPAEIPPPRIESVGTWFDGPGPADARLAARRSVGERSTVAEFSGPYFADSGLVPMQPEFPSTATPRQPTFTPADNPMPPRRDRPQQGSVRDDAVRQAPPRSAPASPHRPHGPHRLRPEPRPEDQGGQGGQDDWQDREREDRIRFGSDQAGWARRPGPGWNEYPPGGFPGQTWPAGSGQVPLGAPVTVDAQAPGPVGTAGFIGAAVPPRAGGAPPLDEPDELFRAWQGSVREAAAPYGHWSTSGLGTSSRRRRAVQVAAIGVPAAVLVAVGAGALMMLTGRANEMLASRANTGAASPAAPDATASARPPATAGVVPPAFAGAIPLPGYPGQRGAVTVASMRVSGGVSLAVGAADGHAAIWRRAATGTWTLESAATLGAVAGRASLASVAHGQAGWIAVGTVSDSGATEPVVLASADGVTWQPLASLRALAGQGTEFLGAAAGNGGYVVVGRQMTGGRIFAVLWYSTDLRNWNSDSNGGLDGRLVASTVNAVASTADGFIAVGSHGAVEAIWISPDGRQWNLRTMNPPPGAHSATLSAVAASGDRVVAAGYAVTAAGDIPVVVVSVDGGVQWQQIVLNTQDGLGVITALTAAPNGFTAAGLAGKHGSAHTVTWTSQDGLTWSRQTQTTDGEITALAATGTHVTGTAEQGTTPTIITVPAP